TVPERSLNTSWLKISTGVGRPGTADRPHARVHISGVPRVVASLWQIDDRATAELMKRFYKSMLTRSERPAAALRDAQMALSKIKGLGSPYYRAAFTLQREWR